MSWIPTLHPVSHLPSATPHAHSLTHLHTSPLPSQVPAGPSRLLKAWGCTQAGRNQDLKDATRLLEPGQARWLPQECQWQAERGCQHPTWLVWQQVTEAGQGETGYQRQDSSPWKDLRPREKPRRNTVPRNGALAGGSVTKAKQEPRAE